MCRKLGYVAIKSKQAGTELGQARASLILLQTVVNQSWKICEEVGTKQWASHVQLCKPLTSHEQVMNKLWKSQDYYIMMWSLKVTNKSYASHEQVINKSCKQVVKDWWKNMKKSRLVSPEQAVSKPWKSHKQVMNNWWANHEQVMDKQWTCHEQVETLKPWASYE